MLLVRRAISSCRQLLVCCRHTFTLARPYPPTGTGSPCSSSAASPALPRVAGVLQAVFSAIAKLAVRALNRHNVRHLAGWGFVSFGRQSDRFGRQSQCTCSCLVVRRGVLGGLGPLTCHSPSPPHPSHQQEFLESIVFSMGAISALGGVAGCLLLPGEQAVAPTDAATWAHLSIMCVLAFVVQVGCCLG